ncbi:MAG TPA: glycosyl hydrolase [Polyangiales bacterium]|nr:glycosyl hydrolase [Polyangiales bacterium]
MQVHAQDKLWGVGLHLGGIKSDYETADTALRGLGADSFRDDLYWRTVEQTRNQFELPRNLGDLQKLIVLGGQNGLRGVVVLDYGNPLYFQGLPKTDADRDAYARYVSWVAQSYGKSVAAFEVWNEWNIGGGSEPRETGDAISAREYVKLLKRVRPVLKADAPGVPVIAGGLANRQLDWVKSFAEHGGFSHCDGFSVHPYNHHDRDASAEDVVRWLDELNVLIKLKAKRPVPIWVTEIGWPTHDGEGASTEVQSAQRLLKMNLLLATRSYIRGVWWYDLFDDGDDPREMEHNFGLIRVRGEKKPSYAALRLFLQHVKQAKFVRDVSAHDAVGLQFKGAKGERLFAVWAREGQSDKRLKVTGGFTLVPIDGANNARVQSELESGSATLGPWPVLLELAPDAKLELSAKRGLGCSP